MADEVKLDLLYGVRAIGKALGLSENQADHLIRAGRIPAFKLGGTICSRRSVLDKWLDEQMPIGSGTPAE